MDNMLYDYDCMIQERKNERMFKGITIWTKLKDKVSLATACFSNSISKIDINTGQPIQNPLILTDEVNEDDLRRKERNSKK
tara:strand:- start:99 stop:341 length:243 start_codon:yes stop_codon:yes gene_type:complete